MSLEIDIHDPRQLDALTEAQLDALPCGAIRVDSDGIILFYSRVEAQLTGRPPDVVLGRNFFTEVAPCTVVPEFYGRFRRGVLNGDLNTSFEFTFDFQMHPVQVRISMRTSDHAGEFWIIVEPLQKLEPRNANVAHELIAEKFAAEPQNAMDRAMDPAGDPATALATISFDFSRCDQEPIAFCGALQPFGCLLVLDPDRLLVDACSANTAMYLGHSPEAVLGKGIRALLGDGAKQVHDCLNGVDAKAKQFCPAFFRIAAPPPLADLELELRLSQWRGRLLLEIEPHAEMDMDRRLYGFDVNALQTQLRQQSDLAEVCRIAADAMRHLSGCERVLAYRLLPDGDGEVIAESLQPDTWPSVLGLRYPATDIPRQARALYLESPLRYAPSRDHADVPLLSRGETAPKSIDIGIAHLRAQSPIHRAYLERFGVNGSMSLSIVYEDRLWGLFIFHHRAPHPVTATVRRRLVELAGFLSARLALLNEHRELQARAQGTATINRMIGEIDIKRTFPLCFQDKADLLRGLADADGIQIFRGDEALFPGPAFGLSAAETQDLLAYLRTQGPDIWSTDCLSGAFEPAAAYPDRLAGVLAVFIGPGRANLILFGRRRHRYNVRWGSDPASLPFPENAGERPFGWPNRSFQVWTEERSVHASPWTALDLATAVALRDLTQQVIIANAAHFENLALHDNLTGLPNRARFRQVIEERIAAFADHPAVVVVGLIDIDHFKTINDTLGHDMGDVLLTAAGERLVAALPPSSTVARLGGDEFALLFSAPHARGVEAIADRVVEQMRDPIIVAGDRFTITVSLGHSLMRVGATPGDLLKEADLALYQAKESGRNRARGFDDQLQRRALQRLRISREVLGRSADDAIEIMLQPQVPIRAPSHDRRFEVLARWRTADGGLLMPEDFIPAAERNGTVREITDAVIRQVLALLRAQEVERGTRSPILAINVTPADLEARWFARGLLDELERAELAPGLLELEITESTLLKMTPNVKASLLLLTEGGVQLALDDFGSGFSSLSHLRELPISIVKIDRPFVRGISTEQDYHLVAAIIAMAHSLNKTVVAEGIETDQQLVILQQLGCDWGQGYLWSKPIPPAEALALKLAGSAATSPG
ncbi:MAG: EAL domain-containing protein [Thiohalocapsa sp.]